MQHTSCWKLRRQLTCNTLVLLRQVPWLICNSPATLQPPSPHCNPHPTPLPLPLLRPHLLLLLLSHSFIPVYMLSLLLLLLSHSFIPVYMLSLLLLLLSHSFIPVYMLSLLLLLLSHFFVPFYMSLLLLLLSYSFIPVYLLSLLLLLLLLLLSLVDCFCITLFSTLEQTHNALVTCDSEWVSSFHYSAFLNIRWRGVLTMLPSWHILCTPYTLTD